MSATITKKVATSTRLVYEVAGDGTATALITNATLLADAVAGPLKDQLNTAHGTQAAARLALLYGDPVQMRTQLQTVVADVTAEVNQPAVDVDMDATATTKAEINLQLSDTTGQKFLLFIEYVHSLVRGGE